jgi:pimeloyl-ACP methyl ester carboxylesterase
VGGARLPVNLTAHEKELYRSPTDFRTLRGKIFFSLAIIILFSVAAFGLTVLRSASILYGISVHRPPLVVRAYDKIFKHIPVMSEFSIQGRNGPLQLRIYTPKNSAAAPTLIIVHGFAPDGNHNEGVNTIATLLCHLGLRVVVPDIPSERMLKMSQTAVADVDDVVRWSEVTFGEKISLFGVSYSGGMVISAAADPEYADYVKMILCISGYNSIDRLGRYYLHDRVLDSSSKPYTETPDNGALAPMALQYLDELVPPKDIGPLSRTLMLIPTNVPPDKAADALALTAEQRLLLNDILGVKSDQMRARYHSLMERHRDELAAISPEGKINNIRGSLYILHGEIDATIPKGEAEWTKSEASKNVKVHLLITPWMHHVFLDVRVPLREKIRVAYFMSHVLDAAFTRSPLPAQKR